MASASWDTKLVRGIGVVAMACAPLVVALWFARRAMGPGAKGLNFDFFSGIGLIVGCGVVVVVAGVIVAAVLTRRGYNPKIVRRLCAACGLLVYLVLIASVTDNGASIVLSLWWMAPFFAGALVLGSARARVGTERYCARCDYPYIDDASVDRCPECGAPWRERFGTVVGRPHTNSRRQGLGIGIMIAAVGLSSLGTFMAPTLLKLCPTSMLIRRAVYTRGFDVEYWAVLNTRTLTPDQIHTLALGLLDERLKTGRMSRDDELWIDGQYRAGVLVPELAKRYFAEMVGPPGITRTPAPANTTPGDLRTLQVEAELRTNISNTQDSRIVVEGWWINGVFTPTSDTGKVLSTYALNPVNLVTGSITAIRVTAPPEIKGPVRVKFVGWIAIGPFPNVAWQGMWSVPPGQPGAVPTVPGATSWMERFEVETTVEWK